MQGKVWLIGNSGMLGNEVESRLSTRGLPYVATDLDCDITDRKVVGDFAGTHRPTWIINCSAYTAVDKAEDEEEKAFEINATGIENIATVADSVGAKVIHVSTDYVFDGEKNGPYDEEDAVNPIGAYGRTKAEGEKRLVRSTERYFLLRTAWLYGRRGNNFVFTMLKLMRERDAINVVSDQWGTPTLADDLAKLIVHIVENGSDAYGTYHFSNEGRTNWYEFAREIYRQARELGLLASECAIASIASEQYPTRAYRPKNSLLSKRKVRETFQFEVESWDSTLNRFLRGLADEAQAD